MKNCVFAVIFMLLAVSLFAQEKVIDNAELLNAQEKLALAKQIDNIATAYKFNLVVVTEKSIDGASVDAYVDSLFANEQYGLNQSKDGCLLFVQASGADRNYRISETGRGMRILNPTAFAKLDKDTIRYLSAGKYYEAGLAFADDWEKFLEMESRGRNYNFFHQYNVLLVIIAWLIAFGIGSLVVVGWKAGMNTALGQTQAQVYVVNGSLNYKEKKDTLTNSKTTKNARQSSSSSSSAARTNLSSATRRSRGGKF